MPSKASKADIRKSNSIRRIEAFGVSFARAFPRWKQTPADLGANTLSAIEGVVKELDKRSLTLAAIEKSLRKAAQVWEGRPNRTANRPSAVQFHRLLDFLRQPPAASDPDRPLLVPRTNVEGGDQENADEEDSEEEEDSAEELSEKEDSDSEEEGGDSAEEQSEKDESDSEEDEYSEEEEDSEDEEGQEKFNHQNQTDNDNSNLHDDEPPPNHDDDPPPNHDNDPPPIHDDNNEQRIIRDNSRTKTVHRRRQKVLIVVPPLNEEEETERSIECGRGAQLHLSRDYTSASNSPLNFSSHQTPPQHPLEFGVNHTSFEIPFALESSGSSSLTGRMARQGSTTPSQHANSRSHKSNHASNNHAKASRTSLQLNQLRSDQDAARQAVNRAQTAYIETEKRLENIIRSCTYEPPTYDITCKEGTLQVHSRQQQQQQQQQPPLSRKRKAQNHDQGHEDDVEDDADDRAVLANRLEQEKHDKEWIECETRALEEFKRRRITSVKEVMGKRRVILEKRAWAQKAVEAADDRIKLESRFESLRERYEGIEAVSQEQPDGLEENPDNNDTHEEDAEGGREGYEGTEGGGGESANGVGNENGVAG